MVRLDAGPLFQRIFCEGQWTRPIKNISENSPDERSDVQPPENRSGPCEESSEYYPKDEKGVENKNKICQSGIQGDGGDNREHDSSLVPIFYAARSLTSAEVADRAQCAQQKK